jgi:hypothetical protein
VRFFLSQTIEPIAFLVYFIAFFFHTKKNSNPRYWVITVYYLFSTIILFRASLRLEGDTSNNLYYNLLYLATSFALPYYYFSLFRTRWKKIVALTVSVITMIYFFSNLDERYFDSIGYIISSIGIVVLIFLFLQELMDHVNEEPISNNFDFWYTCIQLVYQLGSFAIFLSYNYFTIRFFAAPDRETGVMLANLWVIHNLILFIGAWVTVYAAVRVYRKRLIEIRR